MGCAEFCTYGGLSMDDILVRIDRSSVNEESCDLVCRLIDCKGEIERLRAREAERDAALAEVAKQADFIGALVGCFESAKAESLALRAALCLIYDKWEDGTSCCDESGADLGNAMRLDKAEEDSILELIQTSREAT